MGRLAGFSGRQVARVAEELGWQCQRTTGDHMVSTSPGHRRNLSIPAHREVSAGTLAKPVKGMGITVDEFLELARK